MAAASNTNALVSIVVPRLLLFLQLGALALPAAGDFADVNSILRDVAVRLPDVPTMGGSGYSIDLTEVVCTDIYIEDAHLASRSVGLLPNSGGSSAGVASSGVELQWSIEGLAFNCQAKYKYKGLLGIVNRGDVYLYSRDNKVVSTATVRSLLTGSPSPPTEISMNSCLPTVEIVDVDFDNGGFVGWVLDAIEGLLRTAMELVASDKICEELQAFLEVNTKDLLEYIAGENGLEPYLLPGAAALSRDPEQLEEDFVERLKLTPSIATDSSTTKATGATELPATTELLSFSKQDTSSGRWMNELIQKGVFASNEMVSIESDNDAVGPATEKDELQVNQWLREFVLEEDGAMVLTASSVGPDGFPRDGVLYDAEDVVTHTTIVLDRVKLLGLDTLTHFSPFEVAGNYTLETYLAWKYLALEVDVTATVRPSTRPDSVIETEGTSTQVKIVEQVKLMLGVDGLTAGASLMAALNQTALENNVRLGSLLRSNTAAIDCLLSTVVDLEFSTLSVEVTNDVLTPSIEGLVSPGLDRLFSEAMDASFLMYERVLMEAAPVYFQNELRPMLTQRILHEYLLQRPPTTGERGTVGSVTQNSNSRTCIPWTSNEVDDDKPIDFRDLLLTAEDATDLGGSGSAAYGNLFSSMIMPYINEEVLDPDTFNTQWIRKMTKEQSGKEGVLEFKDVYRYLNVSSTSPLYDKLDFRISKITVSNIDTIAAPLEFMQPTNQGNVLSNQLAMHSVTDDAGRFRFLNVTLQVYMGIEGDKSPLQMTNVVDFSISVPASTFSVEILADLKERSLLEFPLKDLVNPHCWLAAFGSDREDDEVEAESLKSIEIESLSFNILTFYLDSVCISATSPGCGSISDVIYELEDAAFATSFRKPIIDLVEDVVLSLWDALDVSELIKQAHKFCPHSDKFEASAPEPTVEMPNLSGVSRNSSQTILALGIVGLQTAIIVSAKNHLLLADNKPLVPNDQSPSAKSETMPFPEGSEIIDWNNLSDLGSWVDIAFDEFRNYLSKSVVASTESSNEVLSRDLASDMTLQINTMLREYILDKSRSLEYELKDLSFMAFGTI
ncbi:unnamed protein product [Pseudo-nitzschia multistriata]|uniref:Lipid-binding serum glycoprotein C-terminal domain-containing protein n=1 Tax=Pseudo-nitzschia multistriata TaxID=183589 RepID=A0A448ZG33_9STRA|nr:unnamed protein product [Pseudo-nitzschia multistriata]